MISEQLRTTLLSLKQISDRLKSLITNSVTKSEATANKQAILNAIDEIELDTSDLAKDATVAKESAATANKEAIIAAINSAEPDLSSVAKETSVKDGNDTTIGMLKDQTNGLSAIKNAAANAASDAAAAKTAAQGITGYALQGIDPTATNTALAALIGYTIQEIDGV